MRGIGAVAAAVALAVLCHLDVQAAARAVSFRTTDGRTVDALFNESAVRPAPAVVLVSMLGRPKEDWQATGQRLSDSGISALMIDLSSGTLGGDGATAAWTEDIRSALTFLQSRPEVSAIGLAGASLGGNLAAVVAASDARVRSLALISPSLDYRGVRIEAAMRQYGERPALLMASRQDPYAARSARELAEDAPGIRELEWSDLAAHGTALLTREPQLVEALVSWFARSLG